MSSLFPLRHPVEPRGDREAAVLDLEEASADEVFEVLAARTTRRVLLSLYDEPMAASDLAETHETTLQNVRYHLQKLLDADLVEVCGTWYSEQGTEMKVYAPTNETLVFVAGDQSRPSLEGALRRLFGAVALVGVASLLVQALSGWLAARSRPSPGTAEGLTADASYARTAAVERAFDPVAYVLSLLSEPGVQAFLLGTVGLLVAFALWYRLRYRPFRTRRRPTAG